MDYQKYVDQLDEDTIKKLKTAVELGRWENGDKLTTEQTDHAMQAVMLWQATHEISRGDEPFKVNGKGEFRVGKGEKLKDTPIEYKTIDNDNLIFSSKN